MNLNRRTSKTLVTAFASSEMVRHWGTSPSRSSSMQQKNERWIEFLPDVVRIFTGADGNLFSETYNQLNAYFAIVPGNYKHNLRKLFLLNSNYADISFLF